MSSDPAPSVTRLGSSSVSSRDADSSAFDEGGFTPGTLLLGRYRIVGLIGRGGMGEVYRAQDLKLGQTVALKFLPETIDRDRSRLDRFLNEVRVARQISHPHVCRVYDVADVDGRHFLSMEFVDGEDLASLLRRIGRLPPDKGVETARQICAGLAAAHDRGVLHRDLKPANIMIDGRGQARLADFGLAAAVDEVRATGEFAGTPMYMAPEQLEGGEISTRTDLYALGLVLHELFTGRRLFENASVQELRTLRRERSSTESSLSSTGVELDPAVERVIRRCLEPDPKARPPSALAVAAALPGGDPLAAALAAGETPSPELVAEAGAVGALRPATAWTLLGAFIVGLVISGWLTPSVRFYRVAPNMRSPEVLASRAADFVRRIGYGSDGDDTAYGWRFNQDATHYVRDHDRSVDRWERLASADAPALEFWFRASPLSFVPINPAGSVTLRDPPLVGAGMTNVTLTSQGRLVSFRGVPPSETLGQTSAAAPDWSPLFAEAGLEASAFSPVEPRETPPTFADVRAAWEGPHPRRPDWTLRVEAAAAGSRPVFFSVLFPWTTARSSDAGSGDWLVTLRDYVQVGVGVVSLVLGLWLARTNTRAGRADTRGAFIVGVAATAPLFVDWLLGVDHVPDGSIEWGRFVLHGGEALFVGLQLWLVYLAIEPYVRRRWPQALISWTRLLTGRFRDPLVGRDILIGVAVGIGLIAVDSGITSLPEWLGQPPLAPSGGGSGELGGLASTGAFVSRIALIATRMTYESLLVLFLLLLTLIVLRNRWLAYGALALMFVALSVNREAVALSIISVVIFVTVVVALVSRVGLLAYFAAMFAYQSLNVLPFTLDASAWFAARSAVTAAMLVGVAMWAFHASLGGRSIFGSTFES